MIGITYLGYSDVCDQRVPLTTLKKKLRHFNLSNIVFTLSRMNVLLGRQRMLREGREAAQDLQYLLIANFIDDELLEGRLKPRFGQSKVDENPVFSRQQILNLLRLCVLVCSESASAITDGKTPEGYELGRCCLIMNDHLVSKKEEQAISEGSDLKRNKHIGLQLAPILELYNPPKVNQAAVRAEIIFSEILNSQEMQAIIQRELKGFDLAKAFLDATGLTIDKYKELILAIITLIYGRTSEELIADPSLLVFRRSQFINNTLITQEDFNRYLSLDSMKLPEAKDLFNEKRGNLRPNFDYVLFRTKPLLELKDDEFICVDPCFIAEKLSTGIYWTIIDSVKKKTAFDAFGYLFEIYVNRMFKQISLLDGLFIPSPKYKTGENSFDGIIWRGNHLIVLEYKASFMRIEAKYSGKVRMFEKELDKKFGIQRGVVQLANHIEWLFHQQPSRRGHIDGLDRVLQNSHSRVEKITPVLIVQEPLLRFSAIEEMLSRRLIRLLKKKKITKAVKVAPLAVIDIDTLEMMKPNLVAGDFTLEQCLNARAARDPNYKYIFHNFVNEYFPQYGKSEDVELDDKFEVIMNRAKQNFFGDTYS